MMRVVEQALVSSWNFRVADLETRRFQELSDDRRELTRGEG
jgi:hypothetical protein